MNIDEAIELVESFGEGCHKFTLSCEHDLWHCVISGIYQGAEKGNAVDAILSALRSAKEQA